MPLYTQIFSTVPPAFNKKDDDNSGNKKEGLSILTESYRCLWLPPGRRVSLVWFRKGGAPGTQYTSFSSLAASRESSHGRQGQRGPGYGWFVVAGPTPTAEEAQGSCNQTTQP
jgi:hypothetical protein